MNKKADFGVFILSIFLLCLQGFVLFLVLNAYESPKGGVFLMSLFFLGMYFMLGIGFLHLSIFFSSVFDDLAKDLLTTSDYNPKTHRYTSRPFSFGEWSATSKVILPVLPPILLLIIVFFIIAIPIVGLYRWYYFSN